MNPSKNAFNNFENLDDLLRRPVAICECSFGASFQNDRHQHLTNRSAWPRRRQSEKIS